jgi:multidrug efflux system outer membrane protein
MTRPLFLAVSAVALVLNSCMVGPKYAKPVAPVAPTFKETAQWKPADGWKIAEPHDEALRGKWWELYGDSKLNELEDQVEPSNQTLNFASRYMADDCPFERTE